MTEFTTESVYEALKSLLGIVDSPERRKQVEDYIEAARMPLDSSGPLTGEQLGAIRRWIDQGALDN